MNKVQAIALLVALALMAGLYVMPIKPPQIADVEHSRQFNMEASDELTLLKEARERQTPSALLGVDTEMDRLAMVDTDSQRIPHLEKLSGLWYSEFNEPLIAGIYAEKVAEILPIGQRWATAGTTYLAGLQKYREGKERTYCFDHAVRALESAISLNPEEVDYRLYLATCYTDMPPQDNPMKGVVMLMGLREQHPNHIGVLSRLGQLAIRTGQFDKALERLNHAHDLAPDNRRVIALLAQAYKASGDLVKATEYEALLKQ